jgi:tyrosine aminotransferase
MYVVPGWRLGWLLIYDPVGAFRDVRIGILKWSQLLLGACTVLQGALEKTLFQTPESYYHDYVATLQKNAEYLHQQLSKIPSLRPVKPQGAMYMMVC